MLSLLIAPTATSFAGQVALPLPLPLIIPISLIVHTTVALICYAPTRQLVKQTGRGESNQVESSRVLRPAHWLQARASDSYANLRAAHVNCAWHTSKPSPLRLAAPPSRLATASSGAYVTQITAAPNSCYPKAQASVTALTSKDRTGNCFLYI